MYFISSPKNINKNNLKQISNRFYVSLNKKVMFGQTYSLYD